MCDTLMVPVGTNELLPWVQRLIKTAVDEEHRRANEELCKSVEDLQRLMQRSLQQTVEGLEKALSEECSLRQKDIVEVTAMLQEEMHGRKSDMLERDAKLSEEQRQRKAELSELEARAAEATRKLEANLVNTEAKLNESRKILNEEIRTQMHADNQSLDNAIKSVRKDTKERLSELESRVEAKSGNAKEEMAQKMQILNSKIEDLSTELARTVKVADELRKEERAASEARLLEEKRAREAEMSQEVTHRKSEMINLEERVTEEARRKEEDLVEEHRQRHAQMIELEARLTKEVRDRTAEVAQVRAGLEEEAAIRKELAKAHSGTERRLAKQTEEFASHKAAVNSALGAKGSAQDMIAVAQALDQKSREADEKLMKTQEKLIAGLQSERKARKEAVQQEHNARRTEVAELGNAVGLDVAKLHDTVAQHLEAERKARASLEHKLASERKSGETQLTTDLANISDKLNETRGNLDAYYEAFNSHQKAVHEALGTKGTARDLIAVAQALEQRAKEAEAQNQTVKRELEDRCGKLASALRESCNALYAQQEEHARKVNTALDTKADLQEFKEVQQELEKKADGRATEEEMEQLAKELNMYISEATAEKEKIQRALSSKGTAADLITVGQELDKKATQDELEGLKEDMEANLRDSELALSALRDAVDSHADAMDAFSADMANTVAKKLQVMQKALDGKASLEAAAACVHVNTYLKDRGIKRVTAKKMFNNDTAKLSMDDISELATIQASARRTSSPSTGRRSILAKTDTSSPSTRRNSSPTRRSARSVYL